MPKLASARSLFHTCGYAPSLLATPQPLTQPGGRTVTPALMSAGSYTDPLTTRFPGRKYAPGACSDALPLVAAISEPPVTTVNASSSGARQRERR
jgi:hypothetical protein